MHRIHFIEIEDQPWCPRAIRDATTDYLQLILNLTQTYEPIASRLEQAIARSGSRQIIDLCSGGGGPWLRLHSLVTKAHTQSPGVLLTDKFPNLAAFERARRLSAGKLDFRVEPLDATHVPPELKGFRTLFTSFHHLRPEAARALLRDAVQQRQPIAVFEAGHRSWMALALTALVPLHILALMPFVRPFRWSSLLWTYLLPAVPLFTLFDAIISCLRVYSPEELRAMTEEFRGMGYHWEIGEQRGRMPVPITYLIGYPEGSIGGQ